MQAYILNLLPRIVSYSETLDKKETFIEKPWVLIDEKGNKTQYIFNRDGRLLISVNGIGHEGTWEYIKGANTLWLKIEEKKYMLKQGFIDPAVMILKLDGPGNDLWTFANENILKDISVDKYIQKIVYQRDSISPIELTDGSILEVVNGVNTRFLIGLKVLMHNEKLDSGIYYSKSGNQYKVKDGKIYEVQYRKTYSIDNRLIEFYCKYEDSISKNDNLITTGFLGENTWYTVKAMDQMIKIVNKRVTGTINIFMIYVLVILLFLVSLVLVLIFL